MDELQELLEVHGYGEWEVVDDAVLTCPCGHDVEYDGGCPEGCVSPLRKLGLI